MDKLDATLTRFNQSLAQIEHTRCETERQMWSRLAQYINTGEYTIEEVARRMHLWPRAVREHITLTGMALIHPKKEP